LLIKYRYEKFAVLGKKKFHTFILSEKTVSTSDFGKHEFYIVYKDDSLYVRKNVYKEILHT